MFRANYTISESTLLLSFYYNPDGFSIYFNGFFHNIKNGYIQTVPCTGLHGIGANKKAAFGHRPLAKGDFKWAVTDIQLDRRLCFMYKTDTL